MVLESDSKALYVRGKYSTALKAGLNGGKAERWEQSGTAFQKKINNTFGKMFAVMCTCVCVLKFWRSGTSLKVAGTALTEEGKY